MNNQIFLAINGFAGHWAVLDAVGIFFAKYFVYLFGAFILSFWLKKSLRDNFYTAFFSAAVSYGFVEVVKRLINLPRPYEVLRVHQLLVDQERGNSFPSGHTVVLFSFAFAFYGTKYFWPFLILAAVGSLARIYVGVHYPGDILASIVIAGLAVFFVKRLFKKGALG